MFFFVFLVSDFNLQVSWGKVLSCKLLRIGISLLVLCKIPGRLSYSYTYKTYNNDASFDWIVAKPKSEGIADNQVMPVSMLYLFDSAAYLVGLLTKAK